MTRIMQDISPEEAMVLYAIEVSFADQPDDRNRRARCKAILESGISPNKIKAWLLASIYSAMKSFSKDKLSLDNIKLLATHFCADIEALYPEELFFFEKEESN